MNPEIAERYSNFIDYRDAIFQSWKRFDWTSHLSLILFSDWTDDQTDALLMLALTLIHDSHLIRIAWNFLIDPFVKRCHFCDFIPGETNTFSTIDGLNADVVAALFAFYRLGKYDLQRSTGLNVRTIAHRLSMIVTLPIVRNEANRILANAICNMHACFRTSVLLSVFWIIMELASIVPDMEIIGARRVNLWREAWI